jgi:flavin-dependent dehydrogenase
MDFDVVIAGGGVAGAACALRLARLGMKVALYERQKLPCDKVSGGFLAPESVAQLEEMRLAEQVLAAGALRVDRAALHSPRGETFTVDLKSFRAKAAYGWAISRQVLDQLLFEGAVAAGAHCRDRARVDSVELDGGGQRMEVTDLGRGEKFSVSCRFFVDAAGKKSKFINHPDGKRAYFGYKAHWPEPILPEGELHLFFFDGGCGAATRVEQNRTCISLLATPQLFRNPQGDYSHLLAATIFQNKSARSLLAPLDPAFLRWLSTGPLVFELLEECDTPWLHIGDAAGMLDPYTGEGIAFALRTASRLAEEIRRGGKYADIKKRFADITREEFDACYARSTLLERLAARPWKLDRVFQLASHSRWLTRKLVALAQAPE